MELYNKWFIICYLLLYLPVQIANGKCASGLYIDNGLGQTVVHHVDTHKEKRTISRDILHILDLPVRPRHSVKTPTSQKFNSASSYIHDIYKSVLDNGLQGSSHLLINQDRDIITESDIIVTYSSIQNSENSHKFWFNFSESPRSRTIIRCDLRLHLKSSHSPFELSAHVLTNSGARLIDKLNVTSTDGGWFKLNATEALRHWLNCIECNQGLQLSIVRFQERGNQVGNVTSFNLINQDQDKRPFLIGYLANAKESPRPLLASNLRLKRGSGMYSTSNYLENPYVLRDPGRRRAGSTGCRLRSLYVHFRELDYDEYIVAPDGYEAHYCAGECRFPLAAHTNATNHALIQALVHFLRPGLVPQVCCAPKQLGHLPVLYSLDGVNHVLKKYRDMVVKSCGCH